MILNAHNARPAILVYDLSKEVHKALRDWKNEVLFFRESFTHMRLSVFIKWLGLIA
jgi:hypothetical protein